MRVGRASRSGVASRGGESAPAWHAPGRCAVAVLLVFSGGACTRGQAAVDSGDPERVTSLRDLGADFREAVFRQRRSAMGCLHDAGAFACDTRAVVSIDADGGVVRVRFVRTPEVADVAAAVRCIEGTVRAWTLPPPGRAVDVGVVWECKLGGDEPR